MPRVFCPCLTVVCHMAHCLVVDSSKREIEDHLVPRSAISFSSINLLSSIDRSGVAERHPQSPFVALTGYEAPSRQLIIE